MAVLFTSDTHFGDHRVLNIGRRPFASVAEMDEALVALAEDGIHLDAMRLRAFPFPASVKDFINTHDHVFVVEQNRDAQMRQLIVNELEIDPSWLIAVLHYDGTPITARFITDAIASRLLAATVEPITGEKAA